MMPIRAALSKPFCGSAQLTSMWLMSPQQPAVQRVTRSAPFTVGQQARQERAGMSAEIVGPPTLSRWTA